VVRTALLALPLLAACTGDIESKLTEGLSPEEAIAVEKWAKKALPVFTGQRTKCVTCHDGTIAAAPAYLAGADDTMRRQTLINFMPRVINLSAPQSSRMLTVGDHSAQMGGVALLSNESTDCLEWIQAERKARPDIEPIRTAQIMPMLCTTATTPCPINMVDLGGLGPTPVAATLSFEVAQVGTDSYFTNVKVKAGAEGIYLEHPLVETYIGGDTMPTPDPVDRLFAVVLNIQPNQEVPVGSGTLTIANIDPANPMSFHFDVIEKVRPGT
jgi:hypothetical protein